MDSFLWQGQTDRLRQGDIIKGVDLPHYAEVRGEIAKLKIVRFPLVVVLTQDCDLERDYECRADEDKSQGPRIVSVLVAPLYHIDDIIAGEHLTRLGIEKAGSLPSGDPVEGGSSRAWRQNENPRYHCLPLSKTGKGLPDVVADFKHYFSVGADYLTLRKRQALLGSLNDLYREDLT